MKLAQIFNSNAVWGKLATLPMNPLVGYKVLKYIDQVEAEYDIAEKQRVAIIHEITDTKDGEEAKIEPNTPEFTEYVNRINKAMSIDSELEPINLSFEDMLQAIGDKNNVFTIQDLALLEPFFKS